MNTFRFLACGAAVASVSSTALAISFERISFGGLTTRDYYGAINNRGDVLVRVNTPQPGDGLVVRRADGLVTDVAVGFRGQYTPGIADNGDVAYWGDAAQQPDMLVRRTFDFLNDQTLLERSGGGLSPSSAINSLGVIATTREIDEGRSELVIFNTDNSVSTPTTLSGTDWRVTGLGPTGSVLVDNYQFTNVTLREILPSGVQVTLYSGHYATALDMNSNGQIVGAIRDQGPGDFYDGIVGAVWQSGVYPNPIRVDPIDEGIGVSFSAINEQGIAVGSMYIDGLTDQYGLQPQIAVIWTEEGGLRRLQDLVDPASGWIVEHVFDINDQNVIYGTGTLNGEHASFLLTIPNGASALPLLSLVALGSRRRR